MSFCQCWVQSERLWLFPGDSTSVDLVHAEHKKVSVEKINKLMSMSIPKKLLIFCKYRCSLPVGFYFYSVCLGAIRLWVLFHRWPGGPG